MTTFAIDDDTTSKLAPMRVDLPADGDDGAPTRIGAYSIEAMLGQGGMGEVYLARDERLGRYVALKRIRADLPVSEHHRARFRREARAVARLSHPAIVQVFDILETEDGDCIVMERVEGTSLTEAIARGEIDAKFAVRLGAEIADGLAEAHGKGLIHRDLKPENVIVTPSGHAKILDFGLARMLWSENGSEESSLEEVSAALTQAGTLVGTVHAMSPEQAGGRPVDHRCDLFSLGGLLYEMLTGKAPFRGDNLLDTLRRVTSEEPEPLSELRPELAPELVSLVEQLLAKAPEARPQNARVVADELDRLRTVAVEGGRWRPLPTGGREGVGEGRGEGPAEGRPAEGSWTAELAELPTGEWPPPASMDAEARTESRTETVVRTLLLVELCERAELYQRHDEAPVVAALARSDRRLRDLVAVHGGLEVEKGETFTGLFERPMDAVSCALALHRALPECSTGLGSDLQAHAAVHLGEVILRHNPAEDVSRGARPLEVEGLAKATAARLLSLAAPRQTLATHGAFDLARRAADGEEGSASRSRDADGADGELRWLAHGRYFVHGVDEPLDVFEVGVDGLAPLEAPTDSTTAQRVLSPSEERMLGWRPAVGQSIPRRNHWTLRKRVGEGGFGEVWLARHKSGERRVFKFCFEAERLRALKREVTLFRLLKEALGHRDDIARILDWHFEDAPYFVESEYTEGGDLVEWAEEQGGLGTLPIETRLELVAEIAEALGAAHSVGILHKDVKPENVLVTRDREGRPRARLTDFGIGLLTERERLDAPGFTALGFTETVTPTDSGAGTLGYLAPELVEGKAATVQADVYSLGVLLYQMVAADFSRTLAPGWERDVADEILAEDIALFTDGRPERRPASALEVAHRLRTLDERRRSRAEEASRRLTLERSQRRRKVATVVASVALVVLAIVAVMAVRENRARRDAEASRERAAMRQEQAEGLIGFMLGDLREKLDSVGRLDVLDEVGVQAMKYFAAVPAGGLSDEELSRRSRALYQIGEVRMRRGDLSAAAAAFGESTALAQELSARAPEDPERLFELGQCHFWLGSVDWMRGDLQAALRRFEAYLAIGEQLVEWDPQKPEWRLELAFGHSNVGRVLATRNEPQAALAHYRHLVTILEDLVDDQPRKAWQAELASAYLLVGAALEPLGQLREALEQYRASLALVRRLRAEEPENAVWRERLVTSLNYVGTALRWFGDAQGALEHHSESLQLAREMAASDADNARWRFFRAMAEFQLATSPGAKDGGSEDEHLRAALHIVEDLIRQDSTRHGWRIQLAAMRTQRALELARDGEQISAMKEVAEARSLFEGLFAETPENADAARLYADSLLVASGFLTEAGDFDAARNAAREAHGVLLPFTRRSRAGYLLAPFARSVLVLGKRTEAAQLYRELTGQGYIDAVLEHEFAADKYNGP